MGYLLTQKKNYVEVKIGWNLVIDLAILSVFRYANKADIAESQCHNVVLYLSPSIPPLSEPNCT